MEQKLDLETSVGKEKLLCNHSEVLESQSALAASSTAVYLYLSGLNRIAYAYQMTDYKSKTG